MPAIVLAALVIAFAAARFEDDPGARAVAAPAADTIGPGLRLLRLAELSQQQRFAEGMALIAALARWPDDPAPAIAVEPHVAPSIARPGTQAPAPPTVWTDAQFAAAVLSAINAERARAGLPPLASDARLSVAATSYAVRLIGASELRHDIDGSTVGSRLAAAGFTADVMLGEVIAGGTAGFSAEDIAQMWMDSPSHREQILSAQFRLAGAGCAFDGAQVRCVVDLAG